MKTLKTTLLISLLSIAAYAQKLPTEQQASLRVPPNFKVDGKATELDNKFQAYNKHVDFYYTMANDDNKLYLTIQATEPSVIRRMCSAGVTLLINKTGKKNEKDGMSITYPVFESNNRFTPILNYRAIATGGETVVRGSEGVVVTNISPGAQKAKVNTDSTTDVMNRNMMAKAKNIRTNGIKDIDSLISVYNTDGIKAASLFDNKLVENKIAYTIELSIDLKQLGLSAKNGDKFTYELRINEVAQHGINIAKDPTGNIMSVNVTAGGEMAQAQTDFWADYTLAK